MKYTTLVPYSLSTKIYAVQMARTRCGRPVTGHPLYQNSERNMPRVVLSPLLWRVTDTGQTDRRRATLRPLGDDQKIRYSSLVRVLFAVTMQGAVKYSSGKHNGSGKRREAPLPPIYRPSVDPAGDRSQWDSLTKRKAPPPPRNLNFQLHEKVCACLDRWDWFTCLIGV